ncbi:MAG: helix-turn-helix domain-containing protein [Burkholderiaceae bacterium]|nr:helix-turn-helix domain-containing protein [Burkholderiaceae bacterium]
MDKLRAYLNGLPVADQAGFAVRCGTTIGYLRKALAIRANLGESLCIAIERESAGAVRCEDLRPDVDWAYLRGTAPAEKAA